MQIATFCSEKFMQKAGEMFSIFALFMELQKPLRKEELMGKWDNCGETY